MFSLASGTTISLPSGGGLVLVGIQLALGFLCMCLASFKPVPLQAVPGPWHCPLFCPPPCSFISIHSVTASGLKLALRATASPVQIHSGPPICLALDRGHLLKAIVGNCHMLGQKGPKIAAVVLCICLRVCSTVCGCAIVLFACGMSSEKRRQVLAPVRVFVLERSGSRRAVKPPRCPGGADGMPSCSRDLTLGQHAARLQEAPGVSREEAVTDEVRPLLPDLRNCLPCRLWCLIDCTLHETRSADDTVSCWDVQE